jgi:hypothetical protein
MLSARSLRVSGSRTRAAAARRKSVAQADE